MKPETLPEKTRLSPQVTYHTESHVFRFSNRAAHARPRHAHRGLRAGHPDL